MNTKKLLLFEGSH